MPSASAGWRRTSRRKHARCTNELPLRTCWIQDEDLAVGAGVGVGVGVGVRVWAEDAVGADEGPAEHARVRLWAEDAVGADEGPAEDVGGDEGAAAGLRCFPHLVRPECQDGRPGPPSFTAM